MRLTPPCQLIVIAALVLALGACSGTSTAERSPERRAFTGENGNPESSHAVCYGPHRDGQRPGTQDPTVDEIREDLLLMAPHWNQLRIYQSSGFATILLQEIRSLDMDMKVVLGVWIAPEERRDENGMVTERFPEAVAANRREVDNAIRLAAAYPEIVNAVCVGNETQIEWSGHRSPLDILLAHVRRTRVGVEVPVSAADDFNFWNKPASRALAAEVDFIMMHAHPLWNGLQLDEALPWVQEQVAAVRALHPDRQVILSETGWATTAHNQGEQAELIKGRPGEPEQKIFFDAVRNWSVAEQMPVFFFEAFDENWKGGDHPNEVEKHWGVFRADRSPKAALGAAPE